jgi:hypothetical protein
MTSLAFLVIAKIEAIAFLNVDALNYAKSGV